MAALFRFAASHTSRICDSMSASDMWRIRSSFMSPSPANGSRARGQGRNRIAHLRRQQRGEAFAHENDRLASFAQRAQLRRQAAQRAHRDLVANLLDDLGRIVGVLLLELVPWCIAELAPF